MEVMNKTEQHKKAVLQALEKSLGIVTTACKIAGVGRTQYYTWLKEDDEFRKATEDIDNITLDFAESQLHQQIKQGSTAATIFYLKTKGIKRGYIERQDINQKTTFESNVSFNDLLKAVRSGTDK
jgi:hypothetical protein